MEFFRELTHRYRVLSQNSVNLNRFSFEDRKELPSFIESLTGFTLDSVNITHKIGIFNRNVETGVFTHFTSGELSKGIHRIHILIIYYIVKIGYILDMAKYFTGYFQKFFIDNQLVSRAY